MACSIMYWMNYTSNKVKLQRRSENAVASGHVLRFLLDPDVNVINATVQASLRNTSYKVQIGLDNSYGVSYSTCDCPLRHYECHHVAAALLYGYKHVSKTDVKCSWLRNPKSAVPTTTMTMRESFPSPNPEYRALKRSVEENDRDYVYARLSGLGRYIAMHWILSPEPSKEQKVSVPFIEDLLMHKDYLGAENPQCWLRKQLVLSRSAVEEVARLTAGQRQSQLWCCIRKLRLTASNFGIILGAIARKRYPPSLKARLLAAYNLEKVAAISWGINHEDSARERYVSYGACVDKTGIWLHESGILGATPDGIVSTPPKMEVHFQSEGARRALPQLLEIKCPYAARNCTVLQAAREVKGFCLAETEHHGLQLKATHDYYHQIQGQLHLSDSRCCDLAIWTSVDLQVIRIERDASWAQNISKMMDFYFSTFLPSLDSD